MEEGKKDNEWGKGFSFPCVRNVEDPWGQGKESTKQGLNDQVSSRSGHMVAVISEPTTNPLSIGRRKEERISNFFPTLTLRSNCSHLALSCFPTSPEEA
jgi:hypothetical protein